jgi:hypothetical protein
VRIAAAGGFLKRFGRTINGAGGPHVGFREAPLAAAEYVAVAAATPALAAERAVLVAAQAVFPVLAAGQVLLVVVPAVFPALVAEPGAMAAEPAGFLAGRAACGLAAGVPQAPQGGPVD